MNTPTAPCAGQWELFDSTDPYDHKRARQLCTTCPIVDTCRTNLAAAREAAGKYRASYGPCGTWAGELHGTEVLDPLTGLPVGGDRNPMRLQDEEDMFTEADARAAHAAWTRTPKADRGDLSDLIKVGERVYQRRKARRNYKPRREVAA